MIDTTEEQYLVQEPQSEYKSEFRDGRAVAMSGTSRAHNLITVNLTGEISRQLQNRTCEVYGSDMRVKVASAHFYTYPDVSAVCAKPEFDDRDMNALVNPILIIEVLSKSTETYDRGEKFQYYKQLGSLRQYVLISQDKLHVESFHRQESGIWMGALYTKRVEALELPSIECRVALAEIYHKVEFAP